MGIPAQVVTNAINVCLGLESPSHALKPIGRLGFDLNLQSMAAVSSQS